jgi:outer membrane immunogenic protein
MKKLALALVAATATFTAGSATAADLRPRAVKAPPPVIAPVANWTGCYVSGGIGYNMWHQENVTYVDGPPRAAVTTQWDAGGRGWTGRAQGGCDYQFGLGGSWNVVVGLFGDYDWTNASGIATEPFFNAYGTEKQSSQWAIGGRIGLLVTPQLLTYFSGGYTETTFDAVNPTFFTGIPPVATGFYVPGQTYKGWFLGSGLEYSLGWAPGLYLKTEYRFSEFDTGNNRILAVGNNAPLGFSVDSTKYVQNITTSLVWKFNFGGAPLVAKY